MVISRSVETSCPMIAIGKSGARSSGPTGCPVPGCNTGGGGSGRSAAMLYQASGSRLSSRTYFTWSDMTLSLLSDGGPASLAQPLPTGKHGVPPTSLDLVRELPLAHTGVLARPGPGV